MADDEYNGPKKDQFFDALADYEEARFNMARAASLAGKVLDGWERKGGNKADIRDGYALRQMNSEEQQAELRRQWRVASWMGMISGEDDQGSFAKLFEAPAAPTGIGGAPAGSRLAVVRAMAAGFNDGRAKKGPGLQDGIALYGWDAGSEEALAYSEGWGDGFKLRPPPKLSKVERSLADEIDQEEVAAGAAFNSAVAAEIAKQDEAAATPAPRRGRPRKNAEENVVPMRRDAVPALPAPDDAWPDDQEDLRDVPRPVH